MYKVISTLYNMTLREDHNTGAVGVGVAVPKNTPMLANEIWTATVENFKIINGVNVKVNAVNDKWAFVVSVNGVAKNLWTAVVHLGVTYCTVEAIVDVPPPDPTVPVFPETYIMYDPKFPNVKAEYNFSRIIQ